MSKITWPNRTDLKTAIGATYEWAAAIANEVKTSINALYDTTEPSTWYVHNAPKGDDSNVGSDKFPFETIEYAVSIKEARDIIVIQNQGFFEDSDLTISTPLHIIGFSGQDIPELLGTWDVTAPIILQMVEFKGAITASSPILIQISGTIFDPTSLPARYVSLEMEQSSQFKTNANTNLASLNGDDSRIIGSTKIKVGKLISLYKFSTDGGFEVGQDGSFTNTIKNVAISGDLTITGDLDQENSTVKGSTTVSGATTGVNQRPYEVIKIPLGARDTAHTTGTNKVGLHIDYNFTFIGLPTLEFDPIITDGGPTGNAFVVDINIADIDGANEASILSTKLSVDAGEFHSSTAATPCVLSSNTIAKYKFISIDIDTIGGTLAGKGGYVTLPGYRT